MDIDLTSTSSKEGGQRQFGLYLRQLRLQRGYDSITDYMRAYNLPISTAYYRDLEKGRRLPSLDSAELICRNLQADKHAFFFHLLNDLLPHKAMHILVSPAGRQEKFAGNMGQAEMKATESGRSPSKSWSPAEEFILSSEAAAFFEENLELFEIAIFIYGQCPLDVTLTEINNYIHQNQLRITSEEAIAKLAEIGVVEVKESSENRLQSLPKQMVVSDKCWLAANHHRRLIRKWAEYLTAKAIRSPHCAHLEGSGSTYITYGLGFVKRSQVESMFQAAEDSLNSVLSGRKQPRAGSKANLPDLVRLLVVSHAELKWK